MIRLAVYNFIKVEPLTHEGLLDYLGVIKETSGVKLYGRAYSTAIVDWIPGLYIQLNEENIDVAALHLLIEWPADFDERQTFYTDVVAEIIKGWILRIDGVVVESHAFECGMFYKLTGNVEKLDSDTARSKRDKFKVIN